MRIKLVLVAVATAFLAMAHNAAGQTASNTRSYRGAIGDSYIQMTLTFDGNSVTGKYSYDRIGQDIKLTGRRDSEGKIELTEFDDQKKPSGKFICKRPFDDPIDRECYWSKPGSARESSVTLNEQFLMMTGGWQVVPKLITNRAKGIVVSY